MVSNLVLKLKPQKAVPDEEHFKWGYIIPTVEWHQAILCASYLVPCTQGSIGKLAIFDTWHQGILSEIHYSSLNFQSTISAVFIRNAVNRLH